MKRILVINPNTTQAVTDMVLGAARQAHPDVQWDGATGAFGAAYIASETAYAIAAHAMLDCFAARYSDHDAVLIACFGDPGLLALRELSPVPVVGLAEASLIAAAALGPFAVVTGGRAWEPMLARFARSHALDAQLVGIHAVELTGAQIAAAPEAAMQSLCEACRLGMAAGAGTIVLGGAALVGMTRALQQRLGIPVLDNVLLGAQAAVDAAVRGVGAGYEPSMSPSPVIGLGSALSQVLARRGNKLR